MWEYLRFFSDFITIFRIIIQSCFIDFKEDVLKGKKILVTGGGTGLGKEMSEHYVKHGAEVVICGRRESVLADTAAEFKEKYGSTVRYQPLDIRSPQDVEEEWSQCSFHEIKHRWGLGGCPICYLKTCLEEKRRIGETGF